MFYNLYTDIGQKPVHLDFHLNLSEIGLPIVPFFGIGRFRSANYGENDTTNENNAEQDAKQIQTTS